MTRPLIAVVLFALAHGPIAQTTFELSSSRNLTQAPQELIGTFGTAEQCKTDETNDSSDMTLLPYVISAQWLRRGFLYCWISWIDHRSDTKGLRARARLRCGEDAVRDYRASFTLKDERLEIRWNDDFATKRLQKCDEQR